MRKLQVGDKVYFIGINRWHDYKTYNFSEVERLTNTMAVLKNGTKLINEPVKFGFFSGDDEVGYSVHGERMYKWRLVTEDVLKDAKQARHDLKVRNWFGEKKFTQEEKNIIYSHFESLNTLN